MQVIITHESADFDAFASAAIARKLYPRAVFVATGGFGRGVREFVTLHRDRFSYVDRSAVDFASVNRVILVDVRRLSRLSKVPALRDRIAARDPALDVHVWDHHAASADDAPASMAVVERVGSATTLLLEEARARAIEIDPVEATLFALGIHADTGSLTFSSTTARDASALAWLMQLGADLSVISRFLEPRWTAAQRQALALALEALTTQHVRGLRVAFASAKVPPQTEGLDEVTSALLHLSECDALFALWIVGARLRVIARARSGAVALHRALESLGGGGHPTAATASLSLATLSEPEPVTAVARAIERAIIEQDVAVLRVRDVMSSPVHSVSPTETLSALRASLGAWRHSGAPVLRERRLVGIVCVADLERAEARGASHLSVSSIMRQPVRTIGEDATLEEALAAMARWDVGRLPVVRDEETIGIITRVDVRRALYASAQ